MNPRSIPHPRAAALAASLLILTAGTASAGSRLVCQAYEIGDEASLPWGTRGWRSPLADYRRDRVVPDTLALLTPERPVLARMETLRRATIYIDRDARLGRELLAALMTRVLDAEAAGRPSAVAWFDAGYLAATYHQARVMEFPAMAEGIDAQRWVARAIQMREGDAAMRFAAALMAYETVAQPGEHLMRAYAGAESDALLDRNLRAHFGPRPAASARR